MFPIVLDLTDRLAVIIGGGTTARRKTAALRTAGAAIRLVCLEARPDAIVEPAVDWVTASYTPEHLDGAALVFAAATAEVNRQVVADARSRRIWVMDAAEPSTGDFHTPATLRQGNLLVAVSTGGASPTLAVRIRDRLAEGFDPAYADWVALLAEYRGLVLHREADPARRQELLAALAEWGWLDRLRGEGYEPVREAMRSFLAARGI